MNILLHCIALSASLSCLLLSPSARAQELVWADRVGGIESDETASVAVDQDGSVYAVGHYVGEADVETSLHSVILPSAIGSDVYVCKFDSSGELVWAKGVGVGGDDAFGGGVEVDDDGNVYVIGSFHGTADFDPGPGVVEFTSAGVSDIFIVKLNADGDLVWAKQVGGDSWDYGNSLVLDADGHIFGVGVFQQTVDFDPGEGVSELTSNGNYDVVVFQLDTDGDFVWARQIGASGWDQGNDIAVDAEGNASATGYFNGTVDFDPGPGYSPLSASGFYDIFVMKLNHSGDLAWAQRMGGLEELDYGQAIAVDAAGDVLTTGLFEGVGDFDPGGGEFLLNAEGEYDVFVSKLDRDGVFVWARQIGGGSRDQGVGLNIDGGGNSYVAGHFSGTVDFDPGPDALELTSGGNYGIFFFRLDAAGNLVWANQALGIWTDTAHDVAVGPDGAVVVGGYLTGTVDFDPESGSDSLISAGGRDGFLAKYSPPSVPSSAGVYFNGRWTLDSNANDVFDAGIDRDWTLGGFGSSQPVTGDWNGDGIDDVGVFNEGYWYLDLNGNGVYDETPLPFGWSGVTPVVGDWNGDGRDSVGVYSNGFWFLDYDGDQLWDNGVNDKIFGFGWTGVAPLVGDWDGDGRDSVAVYSNGFWFFDYDGDTLWDGGTVDRIFGLGWEGAVPVVGDWNGDGADSAGVFSSGTWFLDDNANGVWDGVPTDRVVSFGRAGDTPMPGRW